jgi:hypothetical protein
MHNRGQTTDKHWIPARQSEGDEERREEDGKKQDEMN